MHLGIDADTLQARAIVVTTNEISDSPVGAELLNQIPSHETVASFTGDGAYDTQDVHEACYRRGSIPVIPPRKGALHKGLAFTHRNEAVKACERLGEKVISRTFERQVAELNIRAFILNRFTELGTPQTVVVALLRLGFRIARPQAGLCNKAEETTG